MIILVITAIGYINCEATRDLRTFVLPEFKTFDGFPSMQKIMNLPNEVRQLQDNFGSPYYKFTTNGEYCTIHCYAPYGFPPNLNTLWVYDEALEDWRPTEIPIEN